MESSEVVALRSAGYLHDIGKVAVDKHLFSKASALDADEFRAMADHTLVGYNIVKDVHFPWPQVTEIVRGHHERGDGTGYPDGLRHDETSLPVRIVALADTFDAMTMNVPIADGCHSEWRSTSSSSWRPPNLNAEVLQALLLQVRRDATEVAAFSCSRAAWRAVWRQRMWISWLPCCSIKSAGTQIPG